MRFKASSSHSNCAVLAFELTYSISLKDNYRAKREPRVQDEVSPLEIDLISNGEDVSLLPEHLDIPSS